MGSRRGLYAPYLRRSCLDRICTRGVDQVRVALAGLASTPGAAAKEPAASTLPMDLIAHIDRRFVELGRSLELRFGSEAERPIEIPAYSVALRIRFGSSDERQVLAIQPGAAVEDVLDNVFFMLKPRVPPFSYLEKWALLAVGGSLREPLIVHGLSRRVPAHVVFVPGSEWQAVPLERPYAFGRPLALPEGLGLMIII